MATDTIHRPRTCVQGWLLPSDVRTHSSSLWHLALNDFFGGRGGGYTDYQKLTSETPPRKTRCPTSD